MAGRFVLNPAVGFLQDIENALNDMRLTDLQDGPTTLVSHGGKFLKVKVDETGFEFAASSGGISDGDTLTTGLTFPNTGLHLLDTDASHDLIVKPGSNLTADRTLTITTGDSDRTVTISGNADISGTNTGDQTSVSGNAGTATTLQTSRKINGVGFDGSADIAVTEILLAKQALGSPALSSDLLFPFPISSASGNLGNQQLHLIATYIPVACTVTGVKWFQVTQGNYTANNYNGVGLYSYSGGNLTLVASSTDDGNIWKAAAGLGSKAFSSTYNASAGIYFVGLLYSRSAQTTAPAILKSSSTGMWSAANDMDFTNSAKLFGNISSQTSLPASPTMSGVTGISSFNYWLQLY